MAGRLTPKRTPQETFTYANRVFILAVTRDGNGTKVKIVERVNGSDKLIKVLEATDFTESERSYFTSYRNKAEQLGDAARGKPRGQTPNAAQQNRFSSLTELQRDLISLETTLIQRIVDHHACPLLNTGCFATGTKLLTKRGWLAVELLGIGDTTGA